MLLKVILLSLTVYFAASKIAISIEAGPDRPTTAECFQYDVANGFGPYIMEVWGSDGQDNQYFDQDYKNAKANGMDQVDTYATICDRFTVDQIVSGVSDRLPSDFDGSVWIRIAAGFGTCFGNNTAGHRIEYFEDVVKELKNHGLKIGGIFTDNYSWNAVLASEQIKSSDLLSSLPLWYQGLTNNPNFEDYRQIGGWTQPTMKNYLLGNYMCNIFTVSAYYK